MINAEILWRLAVGPVDLSCQFLMIMLYYASGFGLSFLRGAMTSIRCWQAVSRYKHLLLLHSHLSSAPHDMLGRTCDRTH